MAPRMGERRPVPILDMERERKAAAPGPVITYKLPPEEIERIFSKNKPEKKPSMPGFTRSGGEALRQKESRKIEREDDEPMNMTKSEYLAERLAGKTRMQIARERAKNAPAFYKRLEKWGLKDRAAEEAALAELRAKDNADAADLPRLEQGGDVLKPESAKKTIAEVEERKLGWQSEEGMMAVIADLERRCKNLENQICKLRAERDDLKQALDGAAIVSGIAGQEIARLRARVVELEAMQ